MFQGVTQRLRWQPPGSFLMGSSGVEKGRFDDEGPQQEITFTAGFWMFDTVAAQGLYEVVTGKTPSRFKERNLTTARHGANQSNL